MSEQSQESSLITDLIRTFENLPYDRDQLDSTLRETQLVINKIFGEGNQYTESINQTNFFPDAPSFLGSVDSDYQEAWQYAKTRVINILKTSSKDLETVEYSKNTTTVSLPNTDILKIVGSETQLNSCINKNLSEIKKCIDSGCYFAAIVLMAVTLEALLLARALNDENTVKSSITAEKRKNNIRDWNLATLIDVARELKWIKHDRKEFSDVLRKTRNLIHPGKSLKEEFDFDFDESTCKTCWQVLLGVMDDLHSSVK